MNISCNVQTEKKVEKERESMCACVCVSLFIRTNQVTELYTYITNASLEFIILYYSFSSNVARVVVVLCQHLCGWEEHTNKVFFVRKSSQINGVVHCNCS